jgi:hypothetical protein
MTDTVRHSRAGHAHEHADEHTAHAHEHADHTHEHAVAEAAPASNDNLLLDIGGDTGALIIHAAADRDQAEIEISPAGNGKARTHNIVRRRESVGGARYAAVFPAVPEGDYVIWRDADTPAGTVTVRGGTVASFRFS